MKMWLLLLAVVLLYAFPASLLADTYRCPNGTIVTTGDRIGEVRTKCDRPTSVDKRKELRGVHPYANSVSVEEWTYNEGPNQFVHYLKFENGVLTRVETGTYGR